jgi:O-antigen/teichoic acid export membrane protein
LKRPGEKVKLIPTPPSDGRDCGTSVWVGREVKEQCVWTTEMDRSQLTRSKGWEEKAIRHTILLTSSIILSQILLILRGFIVAKFLGPNLYGLWHGLRVILNNSDYYNLGIYEGMKREVPFYRGKGDLQRVEQMISTTYFSGFLLTLLASCLLIGISLLFSNRFDRVTIISLWIVAGILMVRQLYLFLCKKFESEGRFYSRSKAELLSVWIGVPLAIGLMFILHIYGFLIGILLGYLLAGFAVRKGETIITGHRIRIDFSLELLKVGLPIILIGLLLSALKSMDKLMILYFLGRTQLGYYGMAFVAAGFIGFFPGALRSVLYPRLMEKFGEKGDRLYLKGFLVEPSLLLVFLTLLLIGVVYLFVPAGIRMLLPQYIPSITSMKILTLSNYPMALLEVPLFILIGINLQKKLLPILLGSLVFFFGVNFVVLSLAFGIQGVSFSIGLTFLALTSVVMLLTLDQFNQSFREKALFFSQIYLPFFYAASVLLLLDRVMGNKTGENCQSLVNAFFQCLIFLISLSPVFIYINRKINIIGRVTRAVRLKDAIGRVSFFED